MRSAGRRVSAAALFGAGSAVLLVGYVACAISTSMTGVLIGSVCAGLAFGLAQPIVQTWMTEVAGPEDRGVATSMGACAVFTGAAVSTSLVGGLADPGHFGLLVAIAAIVTVPVVIVGPVARRRYAPVLTRRQSAARAAASAPAGSRSSS